jgi:O-antigen ligase
MDKRYFLLLLVLGVLVMLFFPAISDRMIYMLSPQYIYSSLTAGRLYRWELGWEMFRNNPFLGVGPGHFGGAVSMRYTYYFEDVFYMDNYYLKTAVELGIAGLASFLVLMYSLLSGILKGLMKMKGSEEKTILTGIFTGMAGVLIHGFFENVFEVPGLTVLFWICAGLAMALIYKTDGQALRNNS